MGYVPPDRSLTSVLDDIYGERRYQYDKGYTVEGDIKTGVDLVAKAQLNLLIYQERRGTPSSKWPRPYDRHLLIKAAALLVAEIERLGEYPQ